MSLNGFEIKKEELVEELSNLNYYVGKYALDQLYPLSDLGKRAADNIGVYNIIINETQTAFKDITYLHYNQNYNEEELSFLIENKKTAVYQEFTKHYQDILEFAKKTILDDSATIFHNLNYYLERIKEENSELHSKEDIKEVRTRFQKLNIPTNDLTDEDFKIIQYLLKKIKIDFSEENIYLPNLYNEFMVMFNLRQNLETYKHLLNMTAMTGDLSWKTQTTLCNIIYNDLVSKIIKEIKKDYFDDVKLTQLNDFYKSTLRQKEISLESDLNPRLLEQSKQFLTKFSALKKIAQAERIDINAIDKNKMSF